MPETSAETTKSFGEILVGIDFDPSNDDLVHQIKSKYAEIINLLESARVIPEGQEMHPQRQRYISVAITEAQTAQMRAVKAVTAK